MRARSAYLMTSWWVVGIWIGLTLLTGIVSVISVTQPTWYVRYTLVHAQALQEVTFQVVVSSVGPLGFCRLVSVESHPVMDYPSVTSTHEENELSTPEGDLQTLVISAPPIDDSESQDSTTTLSFTSSLPTATTPLISDNSHSTTTSGAFERFTTDGGREGEESLLDWPPTSYTTLSFQDVKTTLDSLPSPTPFPGLHLPDFAEEKDERMDSITLETTPLPSGMSTIASDGAVTFGNYGIREVVFRVTEGYGDVIEEDQETSLDKGRNEDENSFHFPLQEREKEITDAENSITTERSMTLVGQETTDAGNLLVQSSGIHVTENGTDLEGSTLEKQGYDTHASYRRKKKKKKRRNKKRQKKKIRNQVRKAHRKRQKILQEKRMEDILSTPRTYSVNETFINKSLSTDIEKDIPEDGIRAEFLVQQPPQMSHKRNQLGINYKPRRPILACSGVVVGVRSGSSSVWVLVGVVYGVAGMVQVLVGLFSLLSQAVKSASGRYAHAIWMGNVQVAVVMSQGVTLVLFPLGLGSPLARVECGGSSSVYWSGDCSFGWGYMLAIVSTTLAAYCPCLARLTVYKKYAVREWESLNFF